MAPHPALGWHTPSLRGAQQALVGSNGIRKGIERDGLVATLEEEGTTALLWRDLGFQQARHPHLSAKFIPTPGKMQQAAVTPCFISGIHRMLVILLGP